MEKRDNKKFFYSQFDFEVLTANYYEGKNN